MCEMKSQDFMQQLTPQKKKVRELKYSIYSRVFQTENENIDYISVIIDRHDIKKNIIGSIDIQKEYGEIYAILEGIKFIYNSIEMEYKKFINLKVFSNNTFVVNLLREWIYVWGENDFEKCKLKQEYIVLLKDLYKYIQIIKTSIFWVTKTTDENSWIIYSKKNIN